MNNLSFARINVALDTIEDTTNKAYADLEASKTSLASQPDANRYQESVYDSMFTNLELRESQMGEYVSKLTETKEQIERIINKFHDYSLLIEEVKQIINNQNLRSGLQGKLKQQILNQPNSREIINSLPGPIAISLRNGEYQDAPATKKGGKKIQKKNKKRNTKRKTLKKVYKH